MWRDEAYVLDMLLAARKACQFTEGVTETQFYADELRQQAVMRLIQIIGEAARKVSPEYERAHPEIPWRLIVGMRNRLVHECFRIDPGKVVDSTSGDTGTFGGRCRLTLIAIVLYQHLVRRTARASLRPRR